MKIIATTTFGLESVLKRELENLGYKAEVENGRLALEGDLKDIYKLNLRLRTADRVLIEFLNFKALSFEELFDGVSGFPWEDFIPENANFIVEGRSRKSKLFSISDCQRITEKAIITRLSKIYKKSYFEKDGPRYKLEVSLLDDIASITLDTSGEGLHKRGYREINYKAPISETLAAGLVSLSYWNSKRLLCDPFCGSGTIAIEAAMIGRNIAPGLMRNFDFENFSFTDKKDFRDQKSKCYSEILLNKKLDIVASDISYKAIEIAKNNAELMDLSQDITFFKKDIFDLDLPDDYGVLITNPPYGVRIKGQVSDLQKELGKLYKSLKTWSFYIITSDENFEKDFNKKADRNRKLYNGGIRTYYYQYYGPKPKK